MTPTQTKLTDRQGIEWTARFVHPGGRGKWHIQRTDEMNKTVCGKELPDEIRVTVHHPACCAHCEADAEAFKAAEDYRLALHQYGDRQRQERLQVQREGRFTVYRCKRCGTQHQRPVYGAGVPFCLGEMHQADLEEIEAIGPAWNGASS